MLLKVLKCGKENSAKFYSIWEMSLFDSRVVTYPG